MSTTARRVVRLGAALLLAVAVLVMGAGAASAHATLLSSTPGDRSLTATAPTEITLTYDQPVGVSAGSVKVLGPDGARVDGAEATPRDGGRTVATTLRSGLPTGTYTVLWRVLSADTHTVFGALTFSLGAASAATAGASQAADEATSGRLAEALLDGSRLLLYAGTALLLGGLAFVLVLWAPGRERTGVRRLWWTGSALLVAGTVLGVLVQGPYSQGVPLASAVQPQVLGEVLTSRYGVSAAARLLLLAGLVPVLLRRGRPRGVAALLGTGVLVSLALVGHAGSGDLAALSTVADVLHLAAMAAWLGGLAVLLVVVLRSREPVPSGLLPVWSRYAASAVLVLVVTGGYAAWRQVGELAALPATDYGRLLLVKVGLVAAVLAVAAVSRTLVQRHFRPGPPEPVGAAEEPASAAPSGGLALAVRARPETLAAPAVRRLRRGVLVESALAFVVLVVTSVLVATAPSRETYAPGFDVTAAVGGGLTARIQVDPARSGPTLLRVSYTRADGSPATVVKSAARWTLASAGAVVPATLTSAGTGVYVSQGLQLPVPGQWQLALTTQTGEFDSTTALVAVPVR